MSQKNSNPKSDFIGGMIWVLLLHIAFGCLWFLLSAAVLSAIPYFNKNYNFMLLLLPILFIGITQIIYLLPAYFYFSKKGRSEVGKGIIVGGLITFMVDGACSGTITLGATGIAGIFIMAIVLTIGLVGIGHVTRSRDR